MQECKKNIYIINLQIPIYWITIDNKPLFIGHENISFIIFIIIIYINDMDVSQLRICKPTPTATLKSGHHNIKDAQCVKKNDGRKFYITSYRVSAPRASKTNVFGAQKLKLSSKVAKFSG